MSCITLQTRTGPEEYQVSDLDEVVWWKTENGIKAVGYMDVVSGLMSENDLETCRIKRAEIVREILEQQASVKPKEHRDPISCLHGYDPAATDRGTVDGHGSRSFGHAPIVPRFSIFAHVSRRPIVRLNTNLFPESRSTQ